MADVLNHLLIIRITSIPSNIAFQIALFPHNLPLPSSKTSARIIGSAMHFLHLCTRISQINKVPDSDVGWEDMYHEGEGTPWFDWVRRFLDPLHVSGLMRSLQDLTNDSSTHIFIYLQHGIPLFSHAHLPIP